jgi:hypothetical protein
VFNRRRITPGYIDLDQRASPSWQPVSGRRRGGAAVRPPGVILEASSSLVAALVR